MDNQLAPHIADALTVALRLQLPLHASDVRLVADPDLGPVGVQRLTVKYGADTASALTTAIRLLAEPQEA